MAHCLPCNTSRHLGFPVRLPSGLCPSDRAGCLTAILTNPIWVIKTRMLSTGRNAPGAYRGMLHGMQDILRNEGPKGFWRGLLPSLFGITHGAIQFTAYEELKNYRRRQRG